jgi:hypothetical protein
MRRIKILLGFYLLLIISSVSCREEHFLITDIRFLGANLNYSGSESKFNFYDSTTVFKKDIIFVISYHEKYIADISNVNLIQKCNATSLAQILDNKLLRDTYSITFDKSFIYDNDTIIAGQNIFKIDKIKNEINIFETVMAFESAGADEVIDFSQNFINKVRFDSGKYHVTFSCLTSDNQEFIKHIDVEFKLQ